VQICIKVEQQVLRKGTSRSSYSNSYSKADHKREGKSLKEKPRENPPKAIVQENIKRREESTSSGWTSDIKCFKCLGRGYIQPQCPSMRTISEEEKNVESISEESDSERGKDAYAYEGELLMVRHSLHSQPSPQPEPQRENIFHTRCKISENVCSLIIDSGSCCNCFSARMVDKLKLELLPQPKPFKLHWINVGGDINVKNQVKVKFSVGNYVDGILCDVVPMEACHVFLGRPWQFYKQTIHYGLTNEITFTHKINVCTSSFDSHSGVGGSSPNEKEIR